MPQTWIRWRWILWMASKTSPPESKKAKLEEVTASMVELTERQRRWTIRASKVEEEWNETLEERRKMRTEMGDLILNLHTVDSKFGIQVF